MKKGFTLIELLVVVAIIGILSSVVLASLNTARGRAFDVKVKQQLRSFRSAADIYQVDNGNYGPASNLCSFGMFASTVAGIDRLTDMANYPANSTMVCNSSLTEFAIAVNLNSGVFWCVDSSGVSKELGVALSTATLCP